MHQEPAAGQEPGADSPFGRPRSPRARWLMAATFAALAVAAVLVARFATREAPQQGPVGAGGAMRGMEGMPGMAARSEQTRAVMLTPEQERRIGVTYAQVTLEPLTIEVRTVAQVTVDETRIKTIAPKIDGWVDQLFVNYTGQPVREGDPLLAIYSPTFVAAEQELLLASRLRRDLAAGEAGAREGAEALYEAARRRLLYWDVQPGDVDRFERTGEVQKTVVLRSPVTGVVLEKSVLAGQKTVAGEALYQVADLSVVWVEGEVFERDLAAVRLGQVARLEFQALPGESRSGRIAYIYPTINPHTRTARVRVALENLGLVLKPGMYATILIRSEGRSAVLSVPRSAVFSTGERNLVFVRRADRMLEPREVRLGLATDQRIAVLSGLRAGETVVASATYLVDAESNLGVLMGGMGNMPGMDMTAPGRPKP
jgi:Cu(I)/Ag(I) efflux system membrane fusion protein